MYFLKSLLWFVLSVLVFIALFALVAVMASAINNVSLYEQIATWFGSNSWFGSILRKL